MSIERDQAHVFQMRAPSAEHCRAALPHCCRRRAGSARGLPRLAATHSRHRRASHPRWSAPAIIDVARGRILSSAARGRSRRRSGRYASASAAARPVRGRRRQASPTLRRAARRAAPTGTVAEGRRDQIGEVGPGRHRFDASIAARLRRRTMWDRLLVDCNIATLEGDGRGRNREWRDRHMRTGRSSAWASGPNLPAIARRHVDALGGAWVTPGLVDCHTHLVFGGTRADEHAMRRAGATYEEIAKAGGGIASTVGENECRFRCRTARTVPPPIARVDARGLHDRRDQVGVRARSARASCACVTHCERSLERVRPSGSYQRSSRCTRLPAGPARPARALCR